MHQLMPSFYFLFEIYEYSFYRLPGEAMQIDRIMDAFAKHYCNQNPNLFDEKDTCYILSFAVIMLNTSLHNPNVKTKITCEFLSKTGLDKNIADLLRSYLFTFFR